MASRAPAKFCKRIGAYDFTFLYSWRTQRTSSDGQSRPKSFAAGVVQGIADRSRQLRPRPRIADERHLELDVLHDSGNVRDCLCEPIARCPGWLAVPSDSVCDDGGRFGNPRGSRNLERLQRQVPGRRSNGSTELSRTRHGQTRRPARYPGERSHPERHHEVRAYENLALCLYRPRVHRFRRRTRALCSVRTWLFGVEWRVQRNVFADGRLHEHDGGSRL